MAQTPGGVPMTVMHAGPRGGSDASVRRRLRAMIVEDEFIIALELEMLLSDFGIEVVAAANTGEKALALVAQYRPDFVTMDIKLPGALDGIAVATQIFRTHGIRPIFVSAYKDAEMLARAEAARPLGWVRKPVSPEALRAVIPTQPPELH